MVHKIYSLYLTYTFIDILAIRYENELPKWMDLDPRTRQLLVDGISINSGYNTKVSLIFA
jgi:hypothetical protein